MTSLRDETVALLQQLIRAETVNDGALASGNEWRAAAVLEAFFAGSGVELTRVEPSPGRVSVVARLAGTDPAAESLALVGHTDVVPVKAADWVHPPHSGELIDGEVWGRGAVDMLFLTASYAAIFRRLATSGFAPTGDLVFAAVADEEQGSRAGVGWFSENDWATIAADNVLTEWGGARLGGVGSTAITVGVGEKGAAPRRIVVRGDAAHASAPWGRSNAAVTLAKVVDRLQAVAPAPRISEQWLETLAALELPAELSRRLADQATIDDAIEELSAHPELGELAPFVHAWTHTTVAVTILEAGSKVNVIPDSGSVSLDIRVLPGVTEEDVAAHLAAVAAEFPGLVSVEGDWFSPANESATTTRLYAQIEQTLAEFVPGAKPAPILGVGGSDARFYRLHGANAFGFGILSPELTFSVARNRFHSANERLDLESIDLTVRGLDHVVRNFLSA
ncbi:M20/M25/M40 family metallo-hydrolase [Pseudoclavibacter terrae]|uniref:M20/M25/M40 family metallo-hydrolase n=1 Tax=Pseudoclavibacter terrae TaxID=1530195 RepID=UPI0023313BAC|nr:M20/M25/M40 family metallo-hydrolase [Pseudoclavibacter terrae]